MIDFKDEIIDLLVHENLGLDEKEIEKLVEIPPDYEMGDYAFPCFKLAKTMRKSPMLIAEDLSSRLSNEYFSKVENKAAYVNFYIDKAKLSEITIKEALTKKEKFASSEIGSGKNIVIDYSSTNIAKPFHIGHIRSTVIGDALKKIYRFSGYNTIGINYIGDYGTQFGVMIAAYKRWGDKTAIDKDPIKELLKLYVRYNKEAKERPEMMDEARIWFTKLENKDQEAVDLWTWFRDISLTEFKRVYDLLDIEFDNYNGESYNSQFIPEVLDIIESKNILEESQDAMIIRFDEDMTPAIIKKSDGSSTYITRDIATAYNRKRTYNFDKNIYVVATQQNLHFIQLRAILKKLGFSWAEDCIHVPFGMVSMEDGSMSTREGKVIFLEDVLNKAIEKTREIIEEKNPDLENKEEVSKMIGIGAVKFQELFNNRIKDYTFNWDEILNFEGETGPYVQYTYARANSILNKADFDEKIDLDSILYGLLDKEEEINLIREIYNLSQVINDAREKNEPSILTRHVVNIASTFNTFYNSTKILKTENEDEKKALLALVSASKYAIKNSLSLLGINVPEKM